MDDKTRNGFRVTLEERRNTLDVRLASVKRHPEGTAAAELKDESDRASAAVSTELSLLQRSQAEAMLEAINEALDRIDKGDYGMCLNCEQEIPIKRLDAVPWARFCITCQELMDG